MVGSAGCGHRGVCRRHHSVTNGVTAATRIAVLKERARGETRVSAPPESVRKFIALDARVSVETGAGVFASGADADHRAAGAESVAQGRAMEFRPRLSRVRATDIRSSPANITGDKAVPVAAGPYRRALPMIVPDPGRIGAASEIGRAA